DLRRWRVAFNGAERIDPDVMTRFVERFGLRATTMFPVYGLAEATLAVTFPTLDTAPRILSVDRSALARDGVARDVVGEGARRVVGVGRPVPGIELRITGGAAERRVGEIQIRGSSVMGGYYRASSESVHDGWFATGDLGFLDAGELFITGRHKELVKLNGESYFLEDIEAVARGFEGVRRCVALAVIRDEREAVMLLVESERGDAPALAADLRRAVMKGLGLAIEIAGVERGTIRLTTSGKYQRLAMRDLYERGELAVRLL
ncbi:MAG: AMP-binding protein, partial [Kofleriaceae bacterium]